MIRCQKLRAKTTQTAGVKVRWDLPRCIHIARSTAPQCWKIYVSKVADRLLLLYVMDLCLVWIV